MTDKIEDGSGRDDTVGRRRRLRLSQGERGVAMVAPPVDAAEIGLDDMDEPLLCSAAVAGSAESATDSDRQPR